MDIELKPCPFCGGEARFANDVTYDSASASEGWHMLGEFVHVKCTQCGVRTQGEYDCESPTLIPPNPFTGRASSREVLEKLQDDLADCGKKATAKVWNRRVND